MNYRLLEMLIPILIRVLELILQREEKSDDKKVVADKELAEAVRNSPSCLGKSDEQIIREAFA
jgi:hypothetical protein